MVVMTAFLLSFVAILSRAPLSIDADVFGSSQNCSYAVLVISFRNALGDAEDRIILGYVSKLLGLSLCVLGNFSPRLGPWALM